MRTSSFLAVLLLFLATFPQADSFHLRITPQNPLNPTSFPFTVRFTPLMGPLIHPKPHRLAAKNFSPFSLHLFNNKRENSRGNSFDQDSDVSKNTSDTFNSNTVSTKIGLTLTTTTDNNNDNIVDSIPSSSSSSFSSSNNNNNLLPTLTITFLTALIAGAVLSQSGASPPSSIVLDNLKELTSNPKAFFTDAVTTIQNLGDLGYIYFSLIYIVAEILAIPAIPLTASAGYLFGTLKGTGIVLCSASVAAAVSFLIGRTFLRSYVEGLVEDNPRFSAIDRAIGKEGFKVILLLRLSPIFPFALSNYLYGSTSVAFWEYFWGTLIGFTPGTIAYVYTGSVGKVLTGGDAMGGGEWYVYVGGLVALVGFIKIVSDVATKVVQELDGMDGIEDPLD
ncbi:hypothetical protein TrLO_g13496 [Triparma laevis f. longispina]|uniref:VTT domain-containing protein n=1 Tax=Triparma laevis f. longispina TaxID=1714387 RepID=A0A9W7KZT6_9STRA|nr:hypothetical protein TrLO_g13496 [Triparma laevis f. longispina]